MFILTTIEDLIQIKPVDFEKPSAQAIKDAINAKYSNRVIQKIGLCLCMWDLLNASEGLIGHGTGLVNVNVEFRMVVFRPFRGEILYGRIKSSDEEGITISLEFTNEIFVPYQNLPANTNFEPAESTWVWTTEEGAELFFDMGESVLFRVEQEEWVEKPELLQDQEGVVLEERASAWRVIGSMIDAGLGPTLWWGGEAAEEEEGAEGDDVEMEGAAE